MVFLPVASGMGYREGKWGSTSMSVNVSGVSPQEHTHTSRNIQYMLPVQCIINRLQAIADTSDYIYPGRRSAAL